MPIEPIDQRPALLAIEQAFIEFLADVQGQPRDLARAGAPGAWQSGRGVPPLSGGIDGTDVFGGIFGLLARGVAEAGRLCHFGTAAARAGARAGWMIGGASSFHVLMFLTFFLARFGAGRFGYVLHNGEDDGRKAEIRKTYGRFLVRFFRKKARFFIFLCGFLDAVRATSSPSTRCAVEKNVSFI
jgi:hypothetical protein